MRLFLFLFFVAAVAACVYFIDESNSDAANIALGLGVIIFTAAVVCENLWKHVEYEGAPAKTIFELFTALVIAQSPYFKGNYDYIAEAGAAAYFAYALATGNVWGGENIPIWSYNILIAALLAAGCCLEDFSKKYAQIWLILMLITWGFIASIAAEIIQLDAASREL